MFVESGIDGLVHNMLDYLASLHIVLQPYELDSWLDNIMQAS